MTRTAGMILVPILCTLIAGAAGAREPEHPGAALADAIEAGDCLFRFSDVGRIVRETALEATEILPMAMALRESGYLVDEGQNVQRLVNWGACTAG
ncbi:hypothetical protein N8I71_17360 [Roseibacterium sp. SDUM158016]|uniref:hypothetical protein n=1 Tax=Roseicyclus sediminis TaxID=2980997 RepID=UPI0021CF5E56|nr:hypothetical protein [Roseibacterium sp. SDUM158016]MCU4654611.1 hypothetical protein [Roseibacterium sp. SDUM158016]